MWSLKDKHREQKIEERKKKGDGKSERAKRVKTGRRIIKSKKK